MKQLEPAEEEIDQNSSEEARVARYAESIREF